MNERIQLKGFDKRGVRGMTSGNVKGGCSFRLIHPKEQCFKEKEGFNGTE